MNKRVLIIESNFIIGAHLKILLQKKGVHVYNELVSIKDGIPKDFEPNVIIVNHKEALINYKSILSQLKKLTKIQIIILYCLEPSPLIKSYFAEYQIDCIEKPFSGFDIFNVIAA